MTGRRAGAGRERTSGSVGPGASGPVRAESVPLLTGAVADRPGVGLPDGASGAGVAGCSSRGPRIREAADHRLRVRLRREAGDERFDLRLGSPPRGGEDLGVVLHRQVAGEHAHRREGHGTVGEQIQDRGEAAARARGLDPGSGGVFGQAQGAGAIREERAVILPRRTRSAACRARRDGRAARRAPTRSLPARCWSRDKRSRSESAAAVVRTEAFIIMTLCITVFFGASCAAPLTSRRHETSRRARIGTRGVGVRSDRSCVRQDAIVETGSIEKLLDVSGARSNSNER